MLSASWRYVCQLGESLPTSASYHELYTWIKMDSGMDGRLARQGESQYSR